MTRNRPRVTQQQVHAIAQAIAFFGCPSQEAPTSYWKNVCITAGMKVSRLSCKRLSLNWSRNDYKLRNIAEQILRHRKAAISVTTRKSARAKQKSRRYPSDIFQKKPLSTKRKVKYIHSEFDPNVDEESDVKKGNCTDIAMDADAHEEVVCEEHKVKESTKAVHREERGGPQKVQRVSSDAKGDEKSGVFEEVIKVGSGEKSDDDSSGLEEDIKVGSGEKSDDDSSGVEEGIKVGSGEKSDDDSSGVEEGITVGSGEESDDDSSGVEEGIKVGSGEESDDDSSGSEEDIKVGSGGKERR